MVILSMLTIGLPLQPAFAIILETDQSVSHEPAGQDRAKINTFVDREDVLAQLPKEGVTAGDGILGILLAIFIVLPRKEILGFTKVSPFARSAR
jgi:hypothetical protein